MNFFIASYETAVSILVRAVMNGGETYPVQLHSRTKPMHVRSFLTSRYPSSNGKPVPFEHLCRHHLRQMSNIVGPCLDPLMRLLYIPWSGRRTSRIAMLRFQSVKRA